MNQHLVSRVLLRRWAARSRGPIGVLDLESCEQRIARVEELGSLQGLMSEGVEELERVWSQGVERRLNHAFSLIDAREILLPSNAAHLDYIKDCMALHWSRSFALTVMLRMAQPGLADRVAGSVLRSYTPAQVIHALTGVYVFGFGAEDVVRREIYERLDAQLRGAFLRDQFTGHFEEARRRMADFSLEFCYATVSEFVLSDCPVVTYDKDSDVAGVLYGAPWGTADAIFMALGPHVVAALSRTGRYRDLSESELVQINKLQVRSAYKEMFFRPGSGLGDLIAEALLASRDQ